MSEDLKFTVLSDDGRRYAKVTVSQFEIETNDNLDLLLGVKVSNALRAMKHLAELREIHG